MITATNITRKIGKRLRAHKSISKSQRAIEKELAHHLFQKWLIQLPQSIVRSIRIHQWWVHATQGYQLEAIMCRNHLKMKTKRDSSAKNRITNKRKGHNKYDID